MSMTSETDLEELEELANTEFVGIGNDELLICLSVVVSLHVENGLRLGWRLDVNIRFSGSRLGITDIDNGFFTEFNFTETGERLLWVGFLSTKGFCSFS